MQMKYLRKLTLAALPGVFLTGCTFATSIDNLLSPPKLSVEQEQIYNALTYAEGTDISLKYPKSGKYLSAFIVEDIDGDGGNEAIVFYEHTGFDSQENTLRINVLDCEDDRWKSVFDTSAEGAEIEKVIISKLGENSRVNLIIGSSLINRSEKNVSVYNYKEGLLERTFSESYSMFDVTDLDMDEENEFLLLSGTGGTSPAIAEVYKLDSKGMYHQYPCELSAGYTEFDSICYGSLPGGSPALYIDAVSGAGAIQTDIIYMQDNMLKKMFASSEQAASTERPSGCSSFDIDSDGSIEIPVQTEAPGFEEASDSEKLMLTNWLTVSAQGRLEQKYSSYYSIGGGYVFLFPEKWQGNVTVRRDPIYDEIVLCAYDGEDVGRELMRISRTDDAAEREDRISSGYMLMHTKGESAYLAYIPESDEKDGLSITPGEASIGFRFKE